MEINIPSAFVLWDTRGFCLVGVVKGSALDGLTVFKEPAAGTKTRICKSQETLGVWGEVD